MSRYISYTVWHKGADFYRRTDCYDYTGASVFQEGSIRVASEGGFVIIDSILRRGISHEYEGVLDLYLSEQGIVIVNELPLEDYVSKVVPSEMPVSYGLEAAKLQAVCARTYAYERILHQKRLIIMAHLQMIL